MASLKYFESFYNRLTGPLICMLSLLALPIIFLIPSNEILTSIAKIDVLQQLNFPVQWSLLTVEFLICFLALFLCWSIVEVHRQRSNKFFENLMTLANEVDFTNCEHIRDDLLLRKSIKLVEQTVEDYAMLLLMINKHSPNSIAQNYADNQALDETQEASMEEQPCIMPAELSNKLFQHHLEG